MFCKRTHTNPYVNSSSHHHPLQQAVSSLDAQRLVWLEGIHEELSSSSQLLSQPVHLTSCFSHLRFLDRRKEGEVKEALRIPKTMGSPRRPRGREG
jgi:hypothetical protein